MPAHCRDPERCSVCRQAAGEPIRVRPVTFVGRDLLVDGALAGRPIEPIAASPMLTRAQRKGGRTRTGRSKG